MEIKEEWKAVVGYEELYEVSNMGEVRRAKSKRLLCPAPQSKGYPGVQLYMKGKARFHTTHSLVAIAWLGPRPFPGAQVNHKDMDKTNNKVTNLEWVNQSQNIQHALANGGYKNRKLTKDQILLIAFNVGAGDSYGDVAKKLGVERSTVRDSWKGKIHKNWAA